MNVNNKIKKSITFDNNNIKQNKISNTIFINNSNITISNTERNYYKKIYLKREIIIRFYQNILIIIILKIIISIPL